MKYEEPESMREIHKIREEMYEEMKGLTSAERVRKIKEEAEACKREFGLELPRKIIVKK